MPTYTRVEHDIAAKKIRTGRKTNYFLIPHNGITKGNPVTKWKYTGDLGHLTEVGEVALEAINEQLINEIGNKPMTINDGYSVGDIPFTFHGNSVPTLGAMVGQDLTVYPALEIGAIYSNCCSLICIAHDSTGAPQSSFIICGLSARITGLPGMTADGNSSYTVNLFADSANVMMADKGFIFQAESFWDNGGNITNAAAPDGAKTEFILGDGNNLESGVSPITTAVKIRPSATGFLQYFPLFLYNQYTGGAFVGNREVLTTEATFVPGTGKITFTTAPSDGSRLLVFYLVPEDSINSITATDKTRMYDQWQDFNYNS